MEEMRRIYAPAGYRLIFTSAKEGTGMEELMSILTDRVTSVAGPSGAGKSSIINALTA